MIELPGKPVAEEVQRAIDEELVPLSIAAIVTYLHLVEARPVVEDTPSLSRAIILTASALSQVATIKVRDAGAPRPSWRAFAWGCSPWWRSPITNPRVRSFTGATSVDVLSRSAPLRGSMNMNAFLQRMAELLG